MSKAGFPLANTFARSDVFPLSLSFRLKPSGTNRAQTKEKSRFARKYSLVENRLKLIILIVRWCLRNTQKGEKFRRAFDKGIKISNHIVYLL